MVTLGAERLVAAPLDSTWPVLLDVHRVAAALPGVTLTTVDPDGKPRGQVAVGLDRYQGTMVLEEVDEDSHDVVFRARGRADRGGSAAVATVRGGCRQSTSGTRLVVEANVGLTGDARFEQGASEGWFAEFIAGLEREMLRDTPTSVVVRPARQRLGERDLRVLGLAALLTCGTAIVVVRILLRRRAVHSRTRFGDR